MTAEKAFKSYLRKNGLDAMTDISLKTPRYGAIEQVHEMARRSVSRINWVREIGTTLVTIAAVLSFSLFVIALRLV